MDLEQLKVIIKSSLSNIYTKHRFLFDHIKSIKEETFNHYVANEIANHLNNLSIDYNVDVEYRPAFQLNGESPVKTYNVISPTLTPPVHKIPDIIIHKRGASIEPHNNMVIIECKKRSTSSKDHDAVKSFVRGGDNTNTATYQFGVVIIYMNMIRDKKSKICIYQKNELQDLSKCEYTYNYEPQN